MQYSHAIESGTVPSDGTVQTCGWKSGLGGNVNIWRIAPDRQVGEFVLDILLTNGFVRHSPERPSHLLTKAVGSSISLIPVPEASAIV